MYDIHADIPIPAARGMNTTIHDLARRMAIGESVDLNQSRAMNLYNYLVASNFGCIRRKVGAGVYRCWKTEMAGRASLLVFRLSDPDTIRRIGEYRKKENFIGFDAAMEKLAKYALDAYEQGQA